MLKTIEEWNYQFDHAIGDYDYLKWHFNKNSEEFKFHVFFKPTFNKVDHDSWLDQYVEWMKENYPDIKKELDYTGFCAGFESVVFMFDSEEVAIAFKLRWS